MRKKKKDKKAQEASDKAIMSIVTEEMAQPRMAESARIIIDKQISPRDGKPA
jgi:hypothetical protein